MKKKISVLFLAPGPTYNAESPLFRAKYLALGSHLRSFFLTTSNTAEYFEIDDLAFHSMKRSRWFTNFKFILFCLRKAISMRNHGGVDCIITYDPLKTGFIGVLLKNVLRAKLIVEVNGVYTSSAVWEGGHNSLSTRIKKWIVPNLMSFVFQFSDGIKLQFPAQIDPFLKNVEGQVVDVFSNWIPTSNFVNIKEKKEVLLVGFPFKIKGVDVLIESFKKIAPRFPDWSLKILGWYPDRTELFAAIGDHPQINHQPPFSYSEMAQYIGECGIFVLPSRTDARPRVMIEAAAAGKARIGTNVDGIPTVITDGVVGFLVESENIDQLADTMSLLMEDADLRRRIGTAAADRARSEFSEQKYVQNLVNFIRNVVSG